jgi:putative ABC transport system substrate-binding protein
MAMRRRAFIAGLGGAAAWPMVARAQGTHQSTERQVTIGVLSPFSRADTEQWHLSLQQGLHDLGWIEGSNLRTEYRYADGKSERLPELAAELTKLKVDVIVTAVTADALAAAKATKTIPIVMASSGDPVAVGLVGSLSHPGGNVTGLSQMATDLAGKRLELLKEVAPDISRVAIFWNPKEPISALAWEEIGGPAKRIGIELESLEVKSSDEFDRAFASAINAKANAVTSTPGPIFVDNKKILVEFALANRLPSVFHLPDFVRLGGLLSYGPDRADLFRRAAFYVDKVLKGASPRTLPIEQPTRFELAVNVKTARAIGVTLPQSVLLRADEVIE